MRVDGVGSPLAKVMFVGEAPGEEEDKRGIPFCGKAGAELDYWLGRTCRLDREEIFITNMMRQRPPGNRDPKPEEIARDLPDLWAEIMGVQPEIIVPLGLISTRYFLGEWASMELCHGLPHKRTVPSPGLGYEWTGTVLPIVHPAAGLHQSGYYALTVFGFEQLAKYLHGELPTHEPDTTPTDYQYGPHTADPARWDVVAIDTEGTPENPWCLSYSVADHCAALLKTDTDELAWFSDALQQPNLTVVMHYAPHDLRVLDAMGVHIDTSKVRVFDTMQLAYLAGRLPQGLKALAYRLCGMRMRNYEDVVGPSNERLATEYLNLIEGLFAPAHPKEKKHPVWKAVQRCRKSPRGQRALWVDQQPEIKQQAAEALILRSTEIRGLGSVRPAGEMPVATPDDVPFEEVLPYACADADGTRRVFFKLREYFD